MKKNTNILEILKNFQEGNDYITNKKNERITNCTIYNKELSQILINQWHKEDFFKDFSKTISILGNNKKVNFQVENNYDEKIFYGLREEIPPGETRGEVKQVFYHWKIEKKNQEKSQTETFPNSNKQEQQVEKENNSQNQFQKVDNKDNNSKSIYYGVGAVGLSVLVISILVVWVKRKKVNK